MNLDHKKKHNRRLKKAPAITSRSEILAPEIQSRPQKLAPEIESRPQKLAPEIESRPPKLAPEKSLFAKLDQKSAAARIKGYVFGPSPSGPPAAATLNERICIRKPPPADPSGDNPK